MSRDKENLINAFRKARKEGSEMVMNNRISFEEYAFVCAGFEIQLEQMGVDQ